ncbi:Endoribonuclease Dicer-like 1 [Spatholobus suberectus]|nr:Endoribonuclease Dicer-like 1 [Spatholobus suberectus]
MTSLGLIHSIPCNTHKTSFARIATLKQLQLWRVLIISAHVYLHSLLFSLASKRGGKALIPAAKKKHIKEFVNEVQDELSKLGFNSFSLGDCKAPKVLGDIVESTTDVIFLNSARDTTVVWKVCA